MNFRQFSDEQGRVIVNLDQANEVWMAALRTRNEMPYCIRIKEVFGREISTKSPIIVARMRR